MTALTSDSRNWSFAKRALAENQMTQKKTETNQPKKKKKNKHRQCYWAIIKLPSGQICKYQLSKDLQYAIHHDTPKKAIAKLVNSLIVIPLTDYYEHQSGNFADMTVGKILYIVRLPHTSNSRWITRGQFVHLSKTSPNIKQIYNYLKHDYDPASQRRIKHAIEILTNQTLDHKLVANNIILSLAYMFSTTILMLIAKSQHNINLVNPIFIVNTIAYIITSLTSIVTHKSNH